MAKSSRVCIIALLLLVLIAGGGTGVYFAVRNRSSKTSEVTEPVESPEAETDTKTKPVPAETPEPVEEEVVDIERVNRFYGLSYSPFGLGDDNLCPPWVDEGGMCLSDKQVKKDMAQIASMTNRLKTYSLTCWEASLATLDEAVKYDMEVMLGVWWVGDEAANDEEMEKLEKVLDLYGDTGIITDLMMGNEALLFTGATIESIAAGMKKARGWIEERGLKIKIGTAEIKASWEDDVEPILEQSDWIGLNTHPYYAPVDPVEQNAAEHIEWEAGVVGDYWKEKGYDLETVICETGFPTEGDPNTWNGNEVHPSLDGLTAFMTQMETIVRDTGLRTYFFEPFDGDWKRRWQPYEEHDYHFGLHTCDRKLKDITLPKAGAI